MLCYIAQRWDGYVATHFIHLSNTAASSATSGYVVVLEHFGKTEGTAGGNNQRI